VALPHACGNDNPSPRGRKWLFEADRLLHPYVLRSSGAIEQGQCRGDHGEGPDQTTADDEVVRHAGGRSVKPNWERKNKSEATKPVMAEATEITSSGPAVSKATIR